MLSLVSFGKFSKFSFYVCERYLVEKILLVNIFFNKANHESNFIWSTYSFNWQSSNEFEFEFFQYIFSLSQSTTHGILGTERIHHTSKVGSVVSCVDDCVSDPVMTARWWWWWFSGWLEENFQLLFSTFRSLFLYSNRIYLVVSIENGDLTRWSI